ncbi:hypothetical protein [Dubosiella newyorkensis]|uniref:hypothetical protein n=1 Tax=Dubosiella newyorkensis TaxID=1862672 RepID=UPI003F675396
MNSMKKLRQTRDDRSSQTYPLTVARETGVGSVEEAEKKRSDRYEYAKYERWSTLNVVTEDANFQKRIATSNSQTRSCDQMKEYALT